MKVTVYDCDNIAKIIELPDIDQIESISVAVITGDEVVTFKIKNGKPIRVDACSCRRLINYIDYQYTVRGKDNIRRWLNYMLPRTCICAAYDRRYRFADDG